MKDLRFVEFNLAGKKLFIVKYHSTALKCWIKAYKEKSISFNSLLFHIDKHPDFYFNSKNKEKSINLLNMREQELDEFIRNDLRDDNPEFIVNAMYSRLIKDGISIHSPDYNNGCCYGEFIEEKDVTTSRWTFSENKNEHNFYVWVSSRITNEDLIGSRSLLGDRCKYHDVQKLFSETNSLILDIDLDFFAYSEGKPFAKNKRDITEQLSTEAFKILLDKAKIITIALEPSCCGSDENSREILEIFNNLIFKPNNLDIFAEKNPILSDWIGYNSPLNHL